MEILHSINNTGKDLTMKQMFDISDKLITEQSDEIYGVNTIDWDDSSSWKHLSLIGDEEVISLSHAKVYVFSGSVLCLGRLKWVKSSPEYTALDRIDGEPMEFEWNISQDSPHWSSAPTQEFMNKMGDPAQFQGRIIFMSMFNDIIWGTTDNEQECIADAALVSLFAKRFPAGRWSFLGPGSKKKWYFT